jgi:hypothetical protein
MAIIMGDAAQIGADKLHAGDEARFERLAQLGDRGLDEMESVVSHPDPIQVQSSGWSSGPSSRGCVSGTCSITGGGASGSRHPVSQTS